MTCIYIYAYIYIHLYILRIEYIYIYVYTYIYQQIMQSFASRSGPQTALFCWRVSETFPASSLRVQRPFAVTSISVFFMSAADCAWSWWGYAQSAVHDCRRKHCKGVQRYQGILDAFCLIQSFRPHTMSPSLILHPWSLEGILFATSIHLSWKGLEAGLAGLMFVSHAVFPSWENAAVGRCSSKE